MHPRFSSIRKSPLFLVVVNYVKILYPAVTLSCSTDIIFIDDWSVFIIIIIIIIIIMIIIVIIVIVVGSEFLKSLSVSWYKFLHLSFPFRCLQKFPVSFLKCDIAIPSIHCAVVASIIEHRDANLSVMKFLKCLVSCATEKVRLKDFTSFSGLFVPYNTLVLVIGVYSKNPRLGTWVLRTC